jgi:hypothetical protein
MRHSLIRLSLDANSGGTVSKIQPLTQPSMGRRDEVWARQPLKTGTGATHVKSFHGKLTNEAIGFLDEQINKWLDAHPDYEVKFTSMVTSEWLGAGSHEKHVLVQVWV